MAQPPIQPPNKFDREKHVVSMRQKVFERMVDSTGKELKGVVARRGLVEADTSIGMNIGVDQIMMMPGSAFPPHSHPGDHILYVLRGRGQLLIEGQTVDMVRGSAYFVKAGANHSMKADDNTFLRVLAIGFPHKSIDDPTRMSPIQPEDM